MLDEFGDTLEQVSKDSDEEVNPEGRGVFMTSNKEKVVNFDKFKDSIAKKYALKNSPNSCDALYMQFEDKWFLIEFKNGKIDKEKVFQVRGKIFQSLLLLTEKIDRTIGFTRENLNFILVYNENIPRVDIGNFLYKKLIILNFFPSDSRIYKNYILKEYMCGVKKNLSQILSRNTVLSQGIFTITIKPTGMRKHKKWI
jgi:hypothetical protein